MLRGPLVWSLSFDSSETVSTLFKNFQSLGPSLFSICLKFWNIIITFQSLESFSFPNYLKFLNIFNNKYFNHLDSNSSEILQYVQSLGSLVGSNSSKILQYYPRISITWIFLICISSITWISRGLPQPGAKPPIYLQNCHIISTCLIQIATGQIKSKNLQFFIRTHPNVYNFYVCPMLLWSFNLLALCFIFVLLW